MIGTDLCSLGMNDVGTCGKIDTRLTRRCSRRVPTPSHPGAAPDLQALVLKYGTFDRIPPEAWRAHDAAMAEFQMRIRLGINRDVRSIREARTRTA